MDSFKPYSQTLNDLFLFTFDGVVTKREKIFLIPDYQRQYSWTTKNVQELWNDFQEAYRFDSKKEDLYFLGFITLVYDKKDRRFNVIDGQQRIITLMIMLSVLYHDFELDPDMKKTIHKYLFSDDRDNIKLSFNSIDSKTMDFYKIITGYNESDGLDEKDNNQEIKKYVEVTNNQLKLNHPEYKYQNTANFFYKKFQRLSSIEIKDFIDYIFNHVNVITIVSEEESMALKMFVSLNDRGLALDNGDIFKSWLYSRCNGNTSQIKCLRDTWDSVITTMNSYDIAMNDFMSYYCYYKLKSNPQISSSAELKKYYTISNKDVSRIIIDFDRFAKKIDEVYKSNNLYELGLLYIPWRGYVLTALAALRNNNDYSCETKEIIIKLIHKFYYVLLISNSNINEFKQIAFNLIKFITESRKIEDIEEMLLYYIYGKYNNSYKISNVLSVLKGENVYNTTFLKPTLMALDYYEKHDDGAKYIKMDRNIQIDHIIPQKYYTNDDWNIMLKKFRKRDIANKMHSLGNMALISSKKNVRALNYGYSDKIELYCGKKEKNETKIVTQFETTKWLKKGVWNLNSVNKRSKRLYREILNMLSISKNDKNAKFTIINKQIERNRWEYEGKKYYDSELIEVLLKKYITENNIKSFKGIPLEIRNRKMLSYNIIEEKNIQDISRREVEINGFRFYILQSFVPEVAQEILRSKTFKIKYNPRVAYEENRELLKQICGKVLSAINKNYGNSFDASDHDFSKLKTFIQFYKPIWNKRKSGVHFEIQSDTNRWYDNMFDLKIVLHIEKSTSDECVDYLRSKDISVGDNDDEPYLAHYNHNPISRTIERVCFTNNDANNEKILNKIIDTLIELIDKYAPIIDEAFDKESE